MGDLIAQAVYDDDGKKVDVRIVQADPEIDVSLELLDDLDAQFAQRDGDILTFCGLQYRIVGPSLTVPHCVRAVKIGGDVP